MDFRKLVIEITCYYLKSIFASTLRREFDLEESSTDDKSREMNPRPRDFFNIPSRNIKKI